MHSLNTLLLALVITQRLSHYDIRRADGREQRQKPGPKTNVVSSTRYASDYHRARKIRLKAQGLCIECGTNPARPTLTKCEECELARKVRSCLTK